MSERGKAIEMIQKSGVLNPKMSLDEIMNVATKLNGLEIDPLAAWTFISPNFVYTGDDEVSIAKR